MIKSIYKTGHCKICNSENWIDEKDYEDFICYDCKKILKENESLIKRTLNKL